MEYGEREPLRMPVVSFGLFISVLLYQAPGTGTYVALGTIVLLILSCLMSGDINFNMFYFPIESKAIFIFLVQSILVTAVFSGFPSGFYKYAAQIILFILLINIDINDREYEFIKNVFLISTCFYALLALRYCIVNRGTRYYHGDIVLFGATFDPNFIGIPFVIAAVLLLDNVLKGKKRALSGAALMMLYITIVYTASRGNFLSALLGSGLIFWTYLGDRDVGLSNRILWCVLIVLGILTAAGVFAIAYPAQWARIARLNAYGDNGRFRLWGESIELFFRHPIIGNGVRSMYNVFDKASHNTYLEVLVENGIIGFALLCAFVLRLLKKTFRYDKTLAIAAVAMLAQIFFLDAFDNRCVWAILCWIALLSSGRDEDYEYITEIS